MNIKLEEFGLGLSTNWITPSSETFRPKSWPPSRDWPVSIDRDGLVISRWGDSVWDLTPLAGTTFKLNFGDGPECQTDRLDSANADLLRLAITWRMWGHRAARATGTIQATFTMIRAIIGLCARNKILASDLMRFPKVFEQLPDVIAPSRYESTLSELHGLYDARELIGFVIVDFHGLKRLTATNRVHDTVQTPYIPPRIWVYQVTRLRECIDDFLENQFKIEAFFHFCLDAYIKNFGSLQEALKSDKDSGKIPFTKNSLVRTGCVYQGSFSSVASRHQISHLLVKWTNANEKDMTVKSLSAYMSLVNLACLMYIANFTMQRKEEVASLRASCLIWETDEKFGRVPIICGETTKTDFDSDARWVASPSVEGAIKAMTTIARLRMICDKENILSAPNSEDVEDPYLFSKPNEPWGSGKITRYHVRNEVDSVAEVIRHFPNLFDLNQMRITDDDLKIARQLTPNLPTVKFAVGVVWPLAWHQYRRTSAVNMFSSGLISDSSMQHQMKHCSRLMPLYYGRGYTRLHLNGNVETAVVVAMYESMAGQLKSALNERFVSPHSENRKQSIIVNIVSDKDVKTLTAWARDGKVSFREHRLGGCMKAGVCNYGGVESISRCAGGDGGKPCSDVLFDREKKPQVLKDLQLIEAEMMRLPQDSPRYKALLVNKRGMENYLNVINSH